MKFNYTILSKTDRVLVKFFVDCPSTEGSEFKMEFRKTSKDLMRPDDQMGVSGEAELFTNYEDSLAVLLLKLLQKDDIENCKVCEALRDEKIGMYCDVHKGGDTDGD